MVLIRSHPKSVSHHNIKVVGVNSLAPMWGNTDLFLSLDQSQLSRLEVIVGCRHHDVKLLVGDLWLLAAQL